MFAEIVREARQRQGLTQAAVAAKSGVGRQAIVDLESGIGRLPVLTRVMAALDARLVGLPAGSSLQDRLRAARLRRGWSQNDLARRAGLSKGAVARLELGSARVSTLESVIRTLAPRARARRPDLAQWTHGERDVRFTPTSLVDVLVAVFGEIALDPSADPDAPVRAARYYYEVDDGLAQPWDSIGAVYCNPPWSNGAAFVKKAFVEWRRGACPVAILLLRTKTDGALFHDILAAQSDVFFLRDRVQFTGRQGELVSPRSPWGNMLCVFGCSEAQAVALKARIACTHMAPARRLERGAIRLQRQV